MKRNIIYMAFALLPLAGCNDSFLEHAPKTSMTEGNAFVSYDNFRTYSWGLYGIFSDANNRQNVGTLQSGHGDVLGNYMYMSDQVQSTWNKRQWNLITSSQNTDSSWNFSFIRKVNIMLHNIDSSNMSDKEKEHWRSVGYFFRAFRYYDLLSRYGDVTWLEDVVTDQDTDILFGPRTPRDEVAKNMLENLQYAEQHINVNGEGEGTNTINQACVRAFMSRFCLFEGTWRKYHGLGDADLYLKECERVSKLLIDAFPNIAANYVDVYSSFDLSTVPGILLYKEQLKDLIMTGEPRAERGGGWKASLHARTIARYLCQDGKPIKTSPMYKGDATVNDEFMNRDHRLYWRCIPPYRTKIGSGVAVTPQNENDWWDDSMDPKDRYFIDYMNQINDKNRQFPLRTWQPHFLSRSPMIQSSQFSWGPMRNYGGYYIYHYYNTLHDDDVAAGAIKSVNDFPILRMEEVMLNYAEVTYELGKFDQSIADLTINKLRARANVAPMVVADINESFDPDRDPKVTPMAWEIRRERMVELMCDGFAFDDIRRWKRADYFMNQRPLGVRVAADEKNLYFGANSIFVTAEDVNPESSVTKEDIGRVVCVGDYVKQGFGWKDYMYLNPIPKDQLVLNPNLKQNPGWD